MSTIVQLIVSLLSGGVGSNIAGALLKKYSLRPIGNTVAGLLGGGVGGNWLSSLPGGAQQTGVVADVLGSGVGGAVLMVIVGLIKSAMAKS